MATALARLAKYGKDIRLFAVRYDARHLIARETYIALSYNEATNFADKIAENPNYRNVTIEAYLKDGSMVVIDDRRETIEIDAETETKTE